MLYTKNIVPDGCIYLSVYPNCFRIENSHHALQHMQLCGYCYYKVVFAGLIYAVVVTVCCLCSCKFFFHENCLLVFTMLRGLCL